VHRKVTSRLPHPTSKPGTKPLARRTRHFLSEQCFPFSLQHIYDLYDDTKINRSCEPSSRLDYGGTEPMDQAQQGPGPCHIWPDAQEHRLLVRDKWRIQPSPLRVSSLWESVVEPLHPFFASHLNTCFRTSCRVRSPWTINTNGDPKDCWCLP